MISTTVHISLTKKNYIIIAEIGITCVLVNMGSSELFWSLGCQLISHDQNNSINIGMRRFKSFFGVSPLICEKVFHLLGGKRPRGSKPEHLLWSFLFLKQYNTEHVNHSITKADEKTFRKWVWIFVYLLAELDVVN